MLPTGIERVWGRERRNAPVEETLKNREVLKERSDLRFSHIPHIKLKPPHTRRF
jgi:hypothetical protein